jgi:L-ascorbate metabolism protein UlaG (beta-lactamase superfamily)
MTRNIDLGNLRLEWIGHAGFRIETDQVILYIDPYKVSHGERADIILITHDHYDHCDPSSVSSIRKEDSVIIAPKKCQEKLRKTSEIKSGQTLEKGGARITAIPAYNRTKQFHPHGSGLGYVIEIAGSRIYHAGDTDSIPEMQELGHIDVALLPVGGTYTMNPEEAAEAAEKINADVTIPMHWGDIVGTRKDAEEFRKLAKVRVELLE